jgi:hypothetical protein
MAYHKLLLKLGAVKFIDLLNTKIAKSVVTGKL